MRVRVHKTSLSLRPDPKLLGCKLVGFEVHLNARSSTSKVHSLDADTLSTVVDDLDADSSYDVAVYAVTSVGRSMYSGSATAKTAPSVPGPVEHLSVVRTNATEALITWDAPSGERHPQQLEYRVALLARDLGGCDTNLTLQGLLPFEKHTMRVRAVNSAGEGPLSSRVMVSTTEDVPGEPEWFEVAVVNETTARLAWQPPQEPNGVLTGYEITVMVQADNGTEDEGSVLLATVVGADVRDLLLPQLLNGRSYTATVRATTSVGHGPALAVHFSKVSLGKGNARRLPRRRCLYLDRRKRRSLDVSSGPFRTSTASTMELEEFERCKHPAPGDTASDDGVFVDWTPPRSFQSTYI
ncbi:hypothetical protein HPB51_002001 [Rhipicephalus microplus]|uniref:Fibronectin type-III domain-containing protein n=1 Tax=Rhipicephalus microplus TaxID=6941 RepID=A0A9J6EWG9_RHIMP|nr:hypothetical protein HPB51_002001 [Rhipicephalus microplus]